MWMVLPLLASAQDVVLDGTIEEGGLDHVFLPFEVPAGTVEIEVHLDDMDEDTILDWGVDDPSGHRGWGGGNTEAAIIGVDAASRSYEAGPIEPGTWQVVVGKAKLAGPTASYHVEITFRDAPTLAVDPDRGPYEPAGPIGAGGRWVQGDLHVHSIHSGDASASLDAIADLARAEGLDFVVLTEHNVVSGSDFLTAAQARHPDVLLIPGIEVTTYQGHAGAIGATTWVDHRLGQTDEDGVVDAQDLADAVTDQGAVFSIHHPTLDLGQLCIGCAWDLEIPEGVGGVEIGNGSWSPTGSLFTPSAIAFWDALCADGHRLAALGGSDDHRAGENLGTFDTPIGTSRTAVWVEELTVEGVLDGIRAQRTQVLLDGRASPLLEVVPAGGEQDGVFVDPAPGVRLVLPDEDGELHWFVDGEDVGGGEVEDGESILAVDAPPGPDSVRVRAEWWVDDHPTTVTSHVWLQQGDDRPTNGPTEVEGDDPPKEGCGCSEVSAASYGWWPRRRR